MLKACRTAAEKVLGRLASVGSWWQTRRQGWDRDIGGVWSEPGYLAANPDAAGEVASGRYSSGWAHFVSKGAAQARKWWPQPERQEAGGKTRYCLDPWNYLEISALGGLRPCCNYHELVKLDASADGDGARALHDAPPFVELRSQLLEGKLSGKCNRCHIRQRAEPQAQRFLVQVATRRPREADLTAGTGLRQVRIDINEKCNLRCVYCAVSQPGYAGVEMSEEVFARAERLIAQQTGRLLIALNGHGETTFHPRWVDYCERLLRHGHWLTITTNLAKAYDERELRALARLRTIQVSLDGADDRVMREIRRHVAIRNIVRNLEAVRDVAARLGVPGPQITFSAGIYDPSVWGIEGFVEFLAAHRADGVTFWNLKSYPKAPGARVDVRSLDQLTPDRKTEARALLARARAQLERHGIPYEFAGDFRDREGYSYV